MNTKAIFYAAFAPLIFLSTSCSMQTGKLISNSGSSCIASNSKLLVSNNKTISNTLDISNSNLEKSFLVDKCELKIVLTTLQSSTQAEEIFIEGTDSVSWMLKDMHGEQLYKPNQPNTAFLSRPRAKKSTNVLALISLILSLLAVGLPFLFYGSLGILVLPVALIIPALITGAFALRQMRNYYRKYWNKWMAMMGVTIGFAFSVFLVLILFMAALYPALTSLAIPLALLVLVNMIMAALIIKN